MNLTSRSLHPQSNIFAPEHWCLEYHCFPFWDLAYFQVRTGCSFQGRKYVSHLSKTTPSPPNQQISPVVFAFCWVGAGASIVALLHNQVGEAYLSQRSPKNDPKVIEGWLISFRVSVYFQWLLLMGEILHQLIWSIFHIFHFYMVLYIQQVVVWDFWTINSRLVSGRVHPWKVLHHLNTSSRIQLPPKNFQFLCGCLDVTRLHLLKTNMTNWKIPMFNRYLHSW